MPLSVLPPTRLLQQRRVRLVCRRELPCEEVHQRSVLLELQRTVGHVAEHLRDCLARAVVQRDGLAEVALGGGAPLLHLAQLFDALHEQQQREAVARPERRLQCARA